MRKRGLIERLVSVAIAKAIARVCYVTGLTLLIPVVFLVLLPTEDVDVWAGTNASLIITSILLITVSFLILFWNVGRIGKTLKGLGLMTLIPGVAGILLGILGRPAIFEFLQTNVFAFDTVEPVINFYLDNAIPKVMLLTVAYLFLGIMMWLMGDKVEKGRHFL